MSQLREWYSDPTSVEDPFEEPVNGTSHYLVSLWLTLTSRVEVTLKDVQNQIAEEDARDIAEGKVTLHDVSLGQFLSLGLELEEQQYVPA